MSFSIEPALDEGELFTIADPTILVSTYESVLAKVARIGDPAGARPAYLFTFTGKVNNRDEDMTVTVAMSPEDAFQLTTDVLNGLELLTGRRARPRGGERL